MRMTLEVSLCAFSNQFLSYSMIIGVPDYLLLHVHDAIVLPGEFKADALKDELACSCSFTSCSILTLQGFQYQSVIFLDSCYYVTLAKESEQFSIS